MPFTQRFERVTELQRDVFTVSLACTALGTAFLIAPSSFHRLRFRKHDKEQLLVTGNRLAITGTAFLALAMTSALFVVLDMIYHHLVAVVLTAAVAVVFGWLWYGLPLRARIRMKRCAAWPRSAARGGVLSRAHSNRYERSLRPCLAPPIAPSRRPSF